MNREMQASRAIPTVDELVATLKHTNLRTVVVEGPDDVKIYRGLEDIIGSLDASFLECYGRIQLLSLFSRRSEFPSAKVCFVADQDMWIFASVPSDYSDVIFTNGYSIENDVYQDGDIERKILSANERPDHATIIDELCKWFAFQVDRFFVSGSCLTDPHLSHLIPVPGFTCSQEVLSLNGFRDPRPETYSSLRGQHQRKLRGKLLFEVIVRFSHAEGREPRHSYDSLLDIAVSYGAEGPRMTTIIRSIKAKLT